MAFREVAVTEIREVLRAWLAGAGLRRVAEQAGVDRKTARRYVEAAVAAGWLVMAGWLSSLMSWSARWPGGFARRGRAGMAGRGSSWRLAGSRSRCW
jgi:hypothetical protein